MELKLENKIVLKSDIVTGILDKDNFLISYIEKINFEKKVISQKGKKLTQKDLISLKKDISIITPCIDNKYYDFTVYEYMKGVILFKKLEIKDYRKKIKDSLKIVGFNESYLTKRIGYLSKSEQTFVEFATGLLSNPNILFLDNLYIFLDLKSIKKIQRLVQQLAEQYHKYIFLVTNDIEQIYKYCSYMIILNGDSVVLEGNTKTIFENGIDILLTNGIVLPKTIQFSNMANCVSSKKIGYFSDVRDLIKDVYKKV